MDELRFDGRAVAITGARHGLGREHAVLLGRRGEHPYSVADLIVWARTGHAPAS